MPTISLMQLPKTKSSEEFESMCVDVLKSQYNKRFTKYSCPGKRQYGIDIYYDEGNENWAVAQCKNYLSPSSNARLIKQVKNDIRSAKAKFNIVKFIVMTSSDRNDTVQDAISKLNSSFPIELWFWEDIQEKICDNKDLIDKYFGNFLRSGISLPDKPAFVEDFLLAKAICEEYWEQNIKFKPDESNDMLPARSGIESQEAVRHWCGQLSEKMDAMPILLVGPGGMGKTTFLTYLYQTVKKYYPFVPFAKVVLISLESVILLTERETTNCNPFTNADKSIILKHIVGLSGGETSAWKNAMEKGDGLNGNCPILLLLDGLNELQAYKNSKSNVYKQVLSEIVALSDRVQFPYLKMIITSREETSKEQTSLLDDLIEAKELLSQCDGTSKESFNILLAELKGIKIPNTDILKLLPEMKELFERPMYYKHFKDCNNADDMPKNHYEALEKMYKTLSAQSKSNVAPNAEDTVQRRRCVFEIYLPIAARHMLATGNQFGEDFGKCAEDLQNECSKLLLSKSLDWQKDTETTNARVKDVIDRVRDFLEKADQLLVKRKNGYEIRHQDYRDYLVALYYKQRFELMEIEIDNECWDEELGLDLDTYNLDTLKLVYQALEFTGNFKNLIPELTLPLSSGNLRRYYAVYQLSDWCVNAGIIPTEEKKNLWSNTLKVLEPLLNDVCKQAEYCKRTQKDLNKKIFHNSSSNKIKWLTNILMKACEIKRRDSDFSEARKITEAAKQIYERIDDTSNKQEMINVINHNIAKIGLYEFAETGDVLYLSDSLNKLFDCTLGTEEVNPNLYSCALLSMLLVSPQPKLKVRGEYKQFLKERLKDKANEHPFVYAFWTNYYAIYNNEKLTHSWLDLSYNVKQLLMLLVENKVQIITDFNLNKFSINQLGYEKTMEGLSVIDGPGLSEFPSKENLTLIERFLEITDINLGYYREYLKGLIHYIKNEDAEKAYECFARAVKESNDKDIRAKMWCAFIDGKDKELETIWSDGCKNAKGKTDIDSYNIQEWYNRDFTKLYEKLIVEVKNVRN